MLMNAASPWCPQLCSITRWNGWCIKVKAGCSLFYQDTWVLWVFLYHCACSQQSSCMYMCVVQRNFLHNRHRWNCLVKHLQFFFIMVFGFWHGWTLLGWCLPVSCSACQVIPTPTTGGLSHLHFIFPGRLWDTVMGCTMTSSCMTVFFFFLMGQCICQTKGKNTHRLCCFVPRQVGQQPQYVQFHRS